MFHRFIVKRITKEKLRNFEDFTLISRYNSHVYFELLLKSDRSIEQSGRLFQSYTIIPKIICIPCYKEIRLNDHRYFKVKNRIYINRSHFKKKDFILQEVEIY